MTNLNQDIKNPLKKIPFKGEILIQGNGMKMEKTNLNINSEVEREDSTMVLQGEEEEAEVVEDLMMVLLEDLMKIGLLEDSMMVQEMILR